MCDEKFKGPKWLANHMKQKHPQDVKCNACGMLVENTEEAWDLHETENHLQACLICAQDLADATLELMRAHHNEVHDGKEMQCQKCISVLLHTRRMGAARLGRSRPRVWR